MEKQTNNGYAGPKDKAINFQQEIVNHHEK